MVRCRDRFGKENLMLEVCLGLLLFGAGIWVGRKWPRSAPVTPARKELTKLREDQAAFEALMGYNQRQAYGQEDINGI